MSMSSKAAAAAAEVDAVLAQVRRHLPATMRSAEGSWAERADSQEKTGQHDVQHGVSVSLEADTEVLFAESPTERQQADLGPLGEASFSVTSAESQGAGSEADGERDDVRASPGPDTEALLADNRTDGQQPARATVGKDSSPIIGSAEGVFFDAESKDEYDEYDEYDVSDESVEGDKSSEGDEDYMDEKCRDVVDAAANIDKSTTQACTELDWDVEAPVSTQRMRRRARRRATSRRRASSRVSSARLAQLALPVERRTRKRSVSTEDGSLSPGRATSSITQQRERRLRALESMAAEFATVAAQLSSKDKEAVISQMEAMYSEVLGDVQRPRTARSPPASVASAAVAEKRPSPEEKVRSPSRTERDSVRRPPTRAGDPWAIVRKSAAAMEHSVRQYSSSSEQRPKAVPTSSHRLSQSVEEAELLRSVQKVLGESKALSSDLNWSSVNGDISGSISGLSIGNGSTDMARRLSDLPTRAVRRPPCTAIRWLETGWHHFSSANNSHGFELRNGEKYDTEIETDSDIDDDAASFVRFVRRHAADLGSVSNSSLWERESCDTPMRSSLTNMMLPQSGLSRGEVNMIGRNYLEHCHKNGPKERAVRKAKRQAQALIDKGRYVEAIRLIDKGLVAARERRQNREIDVLSDLCIQARLMLVSELNSVGRATEAIRICTAGLRLLPNNRQLQGAIDGTVPQVLAAEEFLDAAMTSLAMHNYEDAKEAMLKALQLDVASTRLPVLLEEGAQMAKDQGDDEAAATLCREAAALGAFDRRMQAAWVQAERAEHARTSGEQEEHELQKSDVGVGLSHYVRQSDAPSVSSVLQMAGAAQMDIASCASTPRAQDCPELTQSSAPQAIEATFEWSERPYQLSSPAEGELLTPWVSGE